VTGDSHRPPGSRWAINAAIELLGHRWSMLVLRDVIFGRSSARVFGDTSFAAV
jgi:DNA-binding HxlR family transcriptional regulator